MKFGVNRIGRRRAELLFFLLLRVGEEGWKEKETVVAYLVAS